jgi:hypothetical protein
VLIQSSVIKAQQSPIAQLVTKSFLNGSNGLPIEEEDEDDSQSQENGENQFQYVIVDDNLERQNFENTSPRIV